MNCLAEDRISSMQSQKALVQDTKREMIIDGRPKLNNDGLKSSITDLFPWMLEFKKMCRCIHTEKSMASLTELMEFYVRNVSISVNECYTRPLKVTKLKDSISETLLLFMYIYRELSENCSKSIYLNNMSDLLALYIDMELKASRKSKEDHEKISARLTTCLYVYLEHSTEHLLDTLMKIQFMCRNYHHILDPIIMKIMKNIPLHPESNIMYIRYFLIYRLWRKINGDVAVRNQIITTAIKSLGPVPFTFSPCILEDVLPKVPKSQPNFTKTLLQHKFDVKKHCELFIQYCRESHGGVRQNKNGCAASIESSSRINSQTPEDIASKNIELVGNNVNSIISDKNKQNESISLLKHFKSVNLEEQTNFKCVESSSNNISKHVTPKTIKSKENNLRRKCKKSNEIVLIDLTSDTVFEKRIKRRRSRKLPWLKEAKKRIDLKIVKASQKIKSKEKKQENTGHNHLSNNSRNINHHLEDASQLVHATENINSKTNSNAYRTVNDKNNESKMEIDNELVDCAQNVRKLTPMKINAKDVNAKTSCTTPSTIIAKPLLFETSPSTKKVSNTSDSTINGNCFTDDIVSRIESDEKENDRCNKQTVIKRLIETDIFSEPDTCEIAESLKKVCDLETEYPTVNSTMICNQYDFKDNAVNSNHSNSNVINDKIIERVTSSIIIAENVPSDKTLNDVRLNNKERAFDCTRKIVDSRAKCEELNTTQNDKVETNFTKSVETSSIEDGLKCEENKRSSRVLIKSSVIKDKVDLRRESKLIKCTNTIDDVGKIEFRVQTELEICNYDEANKDIKENKSSVVSIRESIFESYSTSKKDISNTVNVTCPSENNENNENSCIDTHFRKSVKSIISEKCDNHFDEYIDKTNAPRESSLSPEVTMTKETDKFERSELKEVSNIDENKYIVQDSDIQENIDGLSLLASVSQHVPHLKPESEIKSEQIRVKDYASLRYTCYGQPTDDETSTNDSTNGVFPLLENPSTEIINRIVGIYPENDLDKVALHVEVTSDDVVTENSDKELSKIMSPTEINVNYDADTLTHNLIPMETNMQTVKENTNVILNGETVVLLQKSPNSNLYIINKAVENLKDHNNDEEINRLKEKIWTSSTEECGQFEAIASLDHTSCNLELAAYTKELPYQESKCLVTRGKGIKVELGENFSEAKSYAKKVSISNDMLSVGSQMYHDVNAISKPIDKRKSSKSNLAYRQNIKQEFNNIPNHIGSNCAIPGCNGIHSHPHEVDAQHPLHIPVTHPTTLPPIYGNCAGNAELCVPYHKHCTSMSCSLQINATTSLHSRAKSGSPCGRSHCSCLNCTYDIVAHCRQCIHPTTDTHVSCIESSPYFLPTHSSIQSPAVQEHDRAKSEAIIGKLYDDQLLCKIEKNLLQSNSLEKLVEVQCETEKLFKKEADNKLPLKKRLKAHAMAYEEMSIKAEKVDNYPAIPMMSIAALEALDNTQKRSTQMVRSEYELSTSRKEGISNSNLLRRDYYKDIYVSGSHQSIAKESTRKLERQFRSGNDQSSNTVCQESCLQKTFKTPAQRKEITSSALPLKGFGTESMGQEETFKKIKKTQSPLRQTRSSKRNVPKVNYSYTDVDPEWNPSGESKRKRKRTSR
ncbi:MATH and LRR domain-containing protein PFE0570w-like isoform X1 [Hylaeus anthracinus]|uniref:MATH and LRR domain-containing protein PFE0570w-like isoform X1 n=2 Tax=Hylaeus anthracinus TaxID=313031 RepID=UPI0023BA3942|nr:MATH and LRR domain-containing protein PFE0570w-like isoform X1 [Hylaeus anthracinus]XP_054000521.1 MATH and LRR domain-containing protein PFE0570w-like isoform X1 [Hylaeus anthracinus]XP_054000522.1 MATH and LRR domain-containing protein PFE0570w-like isoform X1 [Hylaeus anthracinus]